MLHIGKPYWHRRYENGHYYYVLCVIVDNRARLELAGVDWCDACKKGGWEIKVIGYTEPLKNGWHNIDDRHYDTATEARNAAEKLLRQILKKIKGAE